VESADVAIPAVEEGVARIKMTWEDAYSMAKRDISGNRLELYRFFPGWDISVRSVRDSEK
jgi:hypothetical protein